MSDEPHADAIRARIEAIQTDMGEVKNTLAKLADAMVQIARLEERQANHSASMDRAFGSIATLSDQLRLHAEDNKCRFDEMSMNCASHRTTCVHGLDARFKPLEDERPVGRLVNRWVLIAMFATATFSIGIVAAHVFDPMRPASRVEVIK